MSLNPDPNLVTWRRKVWPPTNNNSSPNDQWGQLPSKTYVGQPIMVMLPSTGIMPVTLAKPRGLHTWEALDGNGKSHRISSRWIISAF